MKDTAMDLVKYALLVANMANRKSAQNSALPTVANGIASAATTIGNCVYCAEVAAVQHPMLQEAQVACESMRFFLKLGIDTKAITDKDYAELIKKLSAVKQLIQQQLKA